MKLRNKKTGEIKDLECITIFDRPGKNDIGDAEDEFYTIAELNEQWEDYTPAEPLIKDKDIRKAVRAWAEAEDVTICRVDKSGSCLMNLPAIIQFWGRPFVELNNREYSIDELCGEEE